MISINWNTRVIYIPKVDTTLVQSVPTEIRELDISVFRLALKDLEVSDDGMNFPITHNHNTTVTLSGVTYARIVEIINGYTITFEDGQYAVNLIGANSNIADVVNVNQVSVRASNSAGLVVTTGAGVSPTDVANAVWSHPTGINVPINSANAVWNHSTGVLIAIRLAEVWGRLGLDPTKPLITGATQVTFGDIVMALTELSGQVTLDRQ